MRLPRNLSFCIFQPNKSIKGGWALLINLFVYITREQWCVTLFFYLATIPLDRPYPDHDAMLLSKVILNNLHYFYINKKTSS